jgi:hypothetical protein
MCFSPVGDLVGGAVVAAIGIDACLHVKGRTEYLAVAALPLVLGLHQIDETFVWWALQGHVPPGVGHAAMWVYLVFALVVLPIMVPLLMLMLVTSRTRKYRILPFVGIGAVVSGILLEAMVVGHPSVKLGAYHLAYTIGLRHGVAIIGLYVVATCGPLFVTGVRSIRWFGVANVGAVIVLSLLCASGFTSLWCFYAALVSGAIALHLRLTTQSVGPEAHRIPA